MEAFIVFISSCLIWISIELENKREKCIYYEDPVFYLQLTLTTISIVLLRHF